MAKLDLAVCVQNLVQLLLTAFRQVDRKVTRSLPRRSFVELFKRTYAMRLKVAPSLPCVIHPRSVRQDVTINVAGTKATHKPTLYSLFDKKVCTFPPDQRFAP